MLFLSLSISFSRPYLFYLVPCSSFFLSIFLLPFFHIAVSEHLFSPFFSPSFFHLSSSFLPPYLLHLPPYISSLSRSLLPLYPSLPPFFPFHLFSIYLVTSIQFTFPIPLLPSFPTLFSPCLPHYLPPFLPSSFPSYFLSRKRVAALKVCLFQI